MGFDPEDDWSPTNANLLKQVNLQRSASFDDDSRGHTARLASKAQSRRVRIVTENDQYHRTDSRSLPVKFGL